jgi:hypothetical protein
MLLLALPPPPPLLLLLQVPALRLPVSTRPLALSQHTALLSLCVINIAAAAVAGPSTDVAAMHKAIGAVTCQLLNALLLPLLLPLLLLLLPLLLLLLLLLLQAPALRLLLSTRPSALSQHTACSARPWCSSMCRRSLR